MTRTFIKVSSIGRDGYRRPKRSISGSVYLLLALRWRMRNSGGANSKYVCEWPESEWRISNASVKPLPFVRPSFCSVLVIHSCIILGPSVCSVVLESALLAIVLRTVCLGRVPLTYDTNILTSSFAPCPVLFCRSSRGKISKSVTASSTGDR